MSNKSGTQDVRCLTAQAIYCACSNKRGQRSSWLRQSAGARMLRPRPNQLRFPLFLPLATCECNAILLSSVLASHA